MSRRKPLPLLAPVYVRQRHRPAPGTFDPLELRAGMLVNNIEARAGWVVSNPLYDQTLTRCPQIDPSLPGPGWLHEIYRRHSHQDLVMLPRTLARLKARHAPQPRPAAVQPAQAEPLGQQELFA